MEPRRIQPRWDGSEDRALRGAKLLLVGLLAVCVGTLTFLMPRPARAHDYSVQATAGGADTNTPDCKTCPHTGAPVVIFNGAKTFRYVDLEVKGSFPIRMVREYYSARTYDSPLGFGWAFTYDMRLFKLQNGDVIIREGTGTRRKYVVAGNAYTYSGNLPPSGQLIFDTSLAKFIFATPGGKDYYFDDNGRLEAIQDSAGNRLEFTYAVPNPSDVTGKYPLIGVSRYSIDPTQPLVTAMVHRLTKVEERLANGLLSGRYLEVFYDDANGRITKIQSQDGRVVTYNHIEASEAADQIRGNLAEVEGPYYVADGAGRRTIYKYQDSSYTHAVTYFQYGEGTLGYYNTYDTEGRVITQTHGNPSSGPRGTKLDFVYSTPPDTTVVTQTVYDESGTAFPTNVETYVYDSLGNVLSKTDGAGNVIAYAYDPTSQLLKTKTVERNTGTSLVVQQVVDYTYTTDDLIDIKKTKDATGVVYLQEDFDYDAYGYGFITSYTRSSNLPLPAGASGLNSFVTQYEYYYDASSPPVPVKVKTIKQGYTGQTLEKVTYGYDLDWNLTDITQNDGQVTKFEYYTAADSRRGLLKKTYPWVSNAADPHYQTAYDYDAAGNLTLVEDAQDLAGSGMGTQYTYDARGRVTQILNALDEETIFTYGGPGTVLYGDLLKQVEQGRTLENKVVIPGVITQYLYDSFGYRSGAQRKNDLGTFETWWTETHDTEGHLLSRTDAEGNTATYAYDAKGRLDQTTGPRVGSGSTHYSYGALDNLLKVTDAENLITTYTRNPLGQVLQVEPLGLNPPEITTFTYDVMGNVRTVEDARSNTTIYDYDGLSRVVQVAQPLAQSVGYFYDARGRLDYILNARGQKLAYTYDIWETNPKQEERFQTASDPTPFRTLTFTRNLLGQVETVTDTDFDANNPLMSYTYDDLNRVNTTTSHAIPGGDHTLTYAYHPTGLRKSVSLQEPGGGTAATSYAPDAFGRLATITPPASGATTLAYYGNDLMQQITRASGVATAFQYETDGLLKQIKVTKDAGATTLEQLDITAYTALGLVDTETFQSDGLHDYGYTPAYRLASATHPSGTPALPTSSESFTYDEAGNRTDVVPSAYDANNRLPASDGYAYDADGNLTSRPGGTVYTYNARNRLVSASDGSTTASYAYDPFGRRYRKTVNGTNTYFLWDGDDLLAEYDASGTGTVRYVSGPGYAPVQMAVNNAGTETLYDVHTDHLDTPKFLTDQSGTIVWRSRQLAYGQTVVDEDPDTDGTNITFNIRFPGQYYDAETGLHYNRFRYYDPSLGRYLNQDPIGQVDQPNLFQYAQSDPLNQMDPMGLYSGLEFFLDSSNFATGVADAASFGLGPLARSYLEGKYGAGGYVNECAGSYTAGEWASLAIGVGRIAYAGTAKIVAATARSGLAASAARNTLKAVFRGGIAKGYRAYSAVAMIAKYETDDAIRAAAGKTSSLFNAIGADVASGAAINLSTSECGCGE